MALPAESTLSYNRARGSTSRGQKRPRTSSTNSSDKENASSPGAPAHHSRLDKTTMAVNGNKRRRTANGTSTVRDDTDSAGSGDVENDSGVGGVQTRRASPSHPSEPKPKSYLYYDPQQDQAQKRQIRCEQRDQARDLRENRDEYLKPGSNSIIKAVARANNTFKNVRQTTEAALDSSLLVNLTDLAYRKAAHLALGDKSVGIDLDEFVGACIAYMRQDGVPRSAATQIQDEADGEGEDDIELDWSRLGSAICIPHNVRPAVPGFLLGPLSVQRKTRTATQRRARLNAKQGGDETNPESLTRDDMQSTNENSVRSACKTIKTRLIEHSTAAADRLEAVFDDTTTEETAAVEFRKHRITNTGGPGLFDFVINPSSFAQTIENLFYVSFLIREGEVAIEMDNAGLPSLTLNQESINESRQKKSTRHQAVFGMDMATYRDLIKAFDIKDSLIPTRDTAEPRAVGARGWH